MKIGQFGKVGNKFSADDATFLDRIKSRLASRGHRADLHLVSNKQGSNHVTIGFHDHVGTPTEVEIKAFVAANFPELKIDWRTLSRTANTVELELVDDSEKLPVESLDKIPPAFTAMGTCLYKEAGTEAVWNLQKDGENLVLVRQRPEFSPSDMASFQNIKVGDYVLTTLGRGEVVDKVASALTVKFASGDVREFAPHEIKAHYDASKEKKMLKEYYTKAYGDAAFAEALTKDYGGRKK